MGDFGRINIKLAQLLKQSNISKNKFSQRAELQHSQVSGYCNNTITRLDIDVLARICTVLNCEISDLLEFIPDETEE